MKRKKFSSALYNAGRFFRETSKRGIGCAGAGEHTAKVGAPFTRSLHQIVRIDDQLINAKKSNPKRWTLNLIFVVLLRMHDFCRFPDFSRCIPKVEPSQTNFHSPSGARQSDKKMRCIHWRERDVRAARLLFVAIS